MKETNEKYLLISHLSAIMDALSSVSGQNLEIVLHDLEQPEASVLKIINGHISGRQVGCSLVAGPENDMGFMGLLDQETSSLKTTPEVFPAYRTTGPQGKSLLSSTILFKGLNGRATLSLCFNVDYSAMDAARELFASLLPVTDPQHESNETGLESRMNEIIRSCIPPSGQLRVGATKKEKVEIVRLMQEKGLFIVRGGVEMAARVLGVTRYTIYNYLDEVKKTPKH